MNILVICQREKLATLLRCWLEQNSGTVVVAEDYSPDNPLIREPNFDVIIVVCIGVEAIFRDSGVIVEGTPRDLGSKLATYCMGNTELAARTIIMRHAEERERNDQKCCYLNICKPYNCRCLTAPLNEQSLNEGIDRLMRQH